VGQPRARAGRAAPVSRRARAEVDAARRLLRELGQSERALRSVLEFVRRERVGGPPAPPAPIPADRRVEHKRRALDRLARRWAQLRREIDPGYTWPQAQARVNRAMGVRRRADAGEAQLDDGLAFVRSELAKLARDTPKRPSGCGFPRASTRSPSALASRPGRDDADSTGRRRCTWYGYTSCWRSPNRRVPYGSHRAQR